MVQLESTNQVKKKLNLPYFNRILWKIQFLTSPNSLFMIFTISKFDCLSVASQQQNNPNYNHNRNLRMRLKKLINFKRLNKQTNYQVIIKTRKQEKY